MEKKERERKIGQSQPASSMKKRNTVCDDNGQARETAEWPGVHRGHDVTGAAAS